MGARAAVTRETIGLPPQAAIDQLSLLPEKTGVSEGGPPKIDGPRRVGRPEGSENRDTIEMRRYLSALGYRPGQVALGELGGGGTLDELIARARKISSELGCKPIEAMKLVFAAAQEFATYTGSRSATAAPAVALPAGIVIMQVTPEQARELADQGMMFLGEKPAESLPIIDVTPTRSDT